MFEQERDHLREEVLAMRDKEENDRNHDQKNKRHEKTEMEGRTAVGCF